MMNPAQLNVPDGIPHSAHVEVGVLGAMMLDGVAIEDAIARLGSEDFALDSHQKIFRAITSLLAKGYGIDYTTVRVELERRREIDSVGGPGYLAWLTEGIPRNFNIESYVRIVKDKSLLRQGMSVCHDGMVRCQDASEDGLTVISETVALLARAMEGNRTEPSLGSQSDLEYERLQRQASGDVRTFVTSGLDAFDVTHGGYALRETTVLAARPKVGKSTFLRQGVIANCEKGDFVHLFTPEMPAGQVLRCLWAAVAKVPFSKVRRPERMSDLEAAYVRDAKTAVAGWPLKIDDSSPLLPSEMMARARATIRRQNTKLIGLDYLQKMKFEGRPQDRHIAVTDAMVGLTSLAKNEDVALVVVSSLTEPSGKEVNRVPTLDDLRQSGDIKFEANTILFLHRNMDAETRKLVAEADFIVGAARADADGSRKVYFDAPMQRFVEHQEFLRGFGK